jgi:protein kinase
VNHEELIKLFDRCRIVTNMKRFEELEVLGNGAFGIVTKCRDKETGEIIAIKKMKQRYASFDECLQLKEVKSLRKLKHVNVVKLLQVFRENEFLFLVFELLDQSLLKTISERSSYSEPEIRSIMSQILTGLAYIHRQGFFHRDLKPDNVCWKGDVIKIADFGLAREIRSRPPYTEYTGTRWYRAPEIILRAEFYNSPVDVWAAGAIMAELYSGRPLFQGTSEADQMYKIFGVLGAPTQKSWPDAIRLANRLGIRLPTTAPTGLSALVPNASPPALSLLSDMLKYDPSKRPSASQALRHEFFNNGEQAVGYSESFVGSAAKPQTTSEPCLDEILGTFVKLSTESQENHDVSNQMQESGFEPVVPMQVSDSGRGIRATGKTPPVMGRITSTTSYPEPPVKSDDSDDLFADD